MPVGYFLPPERLVAADFVVRSFQPGDGGRVRAAVAASAGHLAPYVPTWAERDIDGLRAEQIARGARARYLRLEQFTYAVFTPDERELIGTCTLEPGEDPPEIGGWTNLGRAQTAS